MEKYYNGIVKIYNKGTNFNYKDPFNNWDTFASTGTGFFIKLDKLPGDNIFIITAAHVVENYNKLQISIPKYGEQLFDVELFLASSDYDIAYLKIDVEGYGLQDIVNNINYKIGNSDKLSIGDPVNTIGFPQDALNLLYTSGIISGIRDKYIQTDTSLNPGNSGGPLFYKNTIVGVNSAIISKSNNACLVIPINFIHLVNDYIVEQIKNKKEIGKVYYMASLCITYQALSGICENIKGCPEGVLINRIVKNSNSYRSGLRVGYIITKIDDYDIDKKGNTELPWFKYGKLKIENIIRRKKAGEKIVCHCYDFTNRKYVNPITFNLDTTSVYPIRDYFFPVEKPDYEVFNGIVMMNLNTNHIMNKDENEHEEENPLIYHLLKHSVVVGGLYICKIFPESELNDFSSIREGLLIVSINGYPVKNLEGFRKVIMTLLKSGKRDFILLTDSNNIVSMNINQVLEKESKYREKYNYDKTPFIESIEKMN